MATQKKKKKEKPPVAIVIPSTAYSTESAISQRQQQRHPSFCLSPPNHNHPPPPPPLHPPPPLSLYSSRQEVSAPPSSRNRGLLFWDNNPLQSSWNLRAPLQCQTNDFVACLTRIRTTMVVLVLVDLQRFVFSYVCFATNGSLSLFLLEIF